MERLIPLQSSPTEVSIMSGIRSITRRSTIIGPATPTSAPIYVDSDDNIFKFIPAGSGTTEVQVVDASSVQTLTNKTLTSPVIAGTPNLNTLKSAVSTSTVSAGYATDTYLAGSGIAIPTGGWVAGGRFSWIFDMVKTAAGTAQFTVNVRMGTGVVGDTSLLQFQFAAGTAAVDTGTFRIDAHFRTVGSGTSAVLVATIECSHALAATGLISTGASGYGSITSVSSGFDSTASNGVIGLSVNGGASFSGTNTIVEAEYRAF